MTTTATITLHPAFRIGPVRRRLFGAFVEHMGRCVYTGIFEPDHPTADEDGLRTDVLELTRRLGVSTVRYPGGNFVSGYRWEDGVGPVAERPVRRDLAWHSTEPNAFGLHEFMAWVRAARVEPMMAVNLGTRGVQEAVELLEYCNAPAGTALADHRAANGDPDPFGIDLWCLGNEMDGPWQIGHRSAEEYASLAARTGRAMRFADGGVELIACGSSHSSMPTFGRWEEAVLEESGDVVDMISAHGYYAEKGGDIASYLASAADMDRYIEAVSATADHIAARHRRNRPTLISFDEWNVTNPHGDTGAEPTGDNWPVGPRLSESTYTALDAVVLGSLLISLLRHSDRVGAACLAQLVNVHGAIRTAPGGPAWAQTIFHPFALTSAHTAGEVLRPVIDSSTMPTDRYGSVSRLDAVATWDDGDLTVFAVNRGPQQNLRLLVDLAAFGPMEMVEALLLHDVDPYRANTAEEPEAVVPRRLEQVTLGEGELGATLPPISWAMIRLRRVGADDDDAR